MQTLIAEQKLFKWLDHYPIQDENGQAVYHVDQAFDLFQFVVDVSLPDGVPCMHIERKAFNFLPKFSCTFADGRSISISQRFALFGDHLQVDSSDFDVSIDREFASHTTTVSIEGQMVGTINRQWTLKDIYEIDIFDDDYRDLMVAIFIMVDQLADARSRRRR